MLGINPAFTAADGTRVEQGDKCAFRTAKGELRIGKYWYKDSQGLTFYGNDRIMYKGCRFIKKMEE